MLAMAMMTTALTACGGDAKSSSTATDTTVTDSQPQDSAPADTEPAEAGTQEAAPEAGGTLTFGTNAEFPPFEFVTGSGVIDQYDGIDIAIAKQIAEKNDMTPAIENMEFASLLVKPEAWRELSSLI